MKLALIVRFWKIRELIKRPLCSKRNRNGSISLVEGGYCEAPLMEKLSARRRLQQELLCNAVCGTSMVFV